MSESCNCTGRGICLWKNIPFPREVPSPTCQKEPISFFFLWHTYYVFLIKIKGTGLSPSCSLFKLLLYDCLIGKKTKTVPTTLTERKYRYFHFLNQTGCYQKHCCFSAMISLVLLQLLSDDLSVFGAMSTFSKSCFFSLPHRMWELTVLSGFPHRF